ncbi:MAG: methylated-DNA--[protein]-cysteine S-methyltransferase [Burkholderiaceae bacterium]|jgi:methylated-DNA-[protein]-cysteine S-methyltransferase|nr:methylated-DNA--[protein]-cysteine S-methyltransferase [Burkholderiaceae bacterium]
MDICRGVLSTPFGGVTVQMEGEAVVRLAFVAQTCRDDLPASAFARAVFEQLRRYLARPGFPLDFPVRVAGTDFQKRVWSAMRRIPAGETQTYGKIARELGSSPRAVGQACGANPIVLYHPCHRVVSATGLGGFSHQSHPSHPLVRIKRWLLEHEGLSA